MSFCILFLIYGDEYLINMPNNKIIPLRNYGIEIKISNKVVVSRLSVSPFNNFSFGISLSGENIIGTDRVKFYSPCVQLKFVGEHKKISYGLGYDNNKFFSIGWYGILGYNFFDKIILCGGINYPDELKLFAGAEIGIFSRIIGIVEWYNKTINVGIKSVLAEQLFFYFNFNNVNGNINRNLKLVYITHI